MLCKLYSFCIISNFDLNGRKILFEDIKVERSEQQIKLNGSPFIIPGKKLLGCAHDVDHAISKKNRQTEEKVNNKVRIICSPKHQLRLKFLITSVLVYRKCFYQMFDQEEPPFNRGSVYSKTSIYVKDLYKVLHYHYASMLNF